MMPYDRPAVAAYFDQLAEGEWQRVDKHALGAVHEHIHNLYLERFVHAPPSPGGAERFAAVEHEQHR